MKDSVTPAQIAEYRENGFVVIQDFLEPDELENWRLCTEQAVKVRVEQTPFLHNQSAPDDFYAQVFLQALKLAEVHDGMREIMHDERLGRIAADLAGVDGIRIWHDQALIKPPYGNATGWHLDNPFWSFSSRDSISIWVALDDATPWNGCLSYLPGTHKSARFDVTDIGANQRDMFRYYPEWLEIDAIHTPCSAGSAVLHNGLVAHGAGANMTNRPRRAMTCAYMPDGSTFNGRRNVLPEDYHRSLKIGDLLDDDAAVPLIYKRP